MDATTLDNLQVIISAETQGLRTQLNQVSSQIRRFEQTTTRSMDGVSKAFAKVKTAIVALGVGKVLKDSFDAVRSYEANIQNITRLMGESTGKFMGWANSQALAFGMAKTEALQYGAIFSNLLAGFIKDTDTLNAYTVKLLEASAVVAGSTGRTMDDTLSRIRSGLLGNTEAIEDLGINVNIALIRTTNAFKQLAGGKSWQQLDFNTQQQIRLMAILEQASTKYGTSVRSNVNMELAKFVANIKNVTLNIGQALLPIFNSALQVLNNFATALVAVTDRFRLFMNALFGIKQTESKIGSSGGSSGISNVAKDYEQAGTAIQESAKKVEGALASFDEVNTLNESTKAGAGGAGAGSVGLPPLESTDFETSVEQTEMIISPKIKQLMEVLKRLIDIDFQPLLNSLAILKKSLEPVFNLAWEGLLWGIDNVLTPLAHFMVETTLPLFLELLAKAIDVFMAVLEPFIPIFKALWDNFLAPIAQWTGGVIVSVLESLVTLLGNLATWLRENQTLVIALTSVSLALIGVWQITKLLAFIGTLGGVTGAFTTLGAKLGTIASTVLVFFRGKWDSIVLTLMYAKDAVVSIGSIMGSAFTALWGVLKPIGLGLIAGIKAVGASLLTLLANPVTWVIIGIGALIAVIVLLIKNWDTVKEVAINCWQAISTAWQNFAEWVNTRIVQPVGTFFANLWEGIKNGCKTAFDIISSIIKGAVNTIITFLNKPIKTINSLLSIKLPDWLGGKSFNMRIPEIPKLARGGIVDSPTVAMIGEQGKEAIVPLENTSFVTALAKAIGQEIGQRGSNNNTGDTIIQIDGKEIARATAKPMRQEFNRLGLI